MAKTGKKKKEVQKKMMDRKKMMDEIIKRKGFYNEWTICFCYIAEKLFRTKRNEEKLKKIFDIIME